MKKALLIIISFILLTILGTLLHEIGHIVPAKMLGYETTLHYGSMSWDSQSLKYSNQVQKEYPEIDKVPQSEIDKLSKLKSKEENDNLWITLGGPIQTIATGLFGILILYLRRNTLNKLPFGILNWLAVFLAFFWSRQVFNFLIGILNFSLGNTDSPFGGDEAKISIMLTLPNGTIGIITAAIGVVVCSLIVFKIVPRQDRVKFLSSGIVGSAIGYITWFQIIGPNILP